MMLQRGCMYIYIMKVQRAHACVSIYICFVPQTQCRIETSTNTVQVRHGAGYFFTYNPSLSVYCFSNGYGVIASFFDGQCNVPLTDRGHINFDSFDHNFSYAIFERS